MEIEVTVGQTRKQLGLRDVETGVDPQSGEDDRGEIEKIERVYKKLDYRIIPGKMSASC